ncbi:MAG: S24/S26 family peptidase [Eubacteriales bacterium]|nr:S24/S26 family peptidase [Eubacteriales bacterium]
MKQYALPMDELFPLLELQLEHGEAGPLPVTGCSMTPMLRQGRDMVWLTRADGAPRRGDVILYRRANGQFVLHRVIRADVDRLLCCGDNEWRPEEVAYLQIRAAMSAFRRRGRRYSANHPLYRLYICLCVELFPARRLLIAARRTLGRLKRRIRSRIAE